MKHVLILAAAACVLFACSKPGETPAEVYLDYHARSAEGMTFEEDITYYSAATLATVEDRIASLVERSGRTREEAIELYLDLSQAGAKCSRLELVEERIDGATAELVFNASSTCPDASSPSQQKVTLVLEGGWKLEDVEIVL